MKAKPGIYDACGLDEYELCHPVVNEDFDIFADQIDGTPRQASTVWRFDDGRISYIRKYAFRASVIQGVDIFKIPNLRAEPTFVSHRFVDLWKKSRLKGLEFTQRWASPN